MRRKNLNARRWTKYVTRAAENHNFVLFVLFNLTANKSKNRAQKEKFVETLQKSS